MPTFDVTRKGRLGFLALLCSFACLLSAVGAQSSDAATAPTGPSTRIVNGTVVPDLTSNWPYIVALVDSTDFQFCGGTVVAASWVITAAHCETVDAIIVGRKRLSTTGGERITVDSQIVNPGWDSNTMANDVQLLHLSHPITNAQPITMIDAADDPIAGATVQVAGWGVTSSGSNATVDDLRQADVNVISNVSCNNSYGGGILSGMLCASYFDPVNPNTGPNRDTCQGDSGGPLVANTPSGPALAGITSWGNGCAQYPFPGVYTRVSSYKSWALSMMGKKASFTSTGNFGSKNVDGSTYELAITVLSSGALPVAVTGSSMTGSADMSIGSDNCTPAGALAPGGSCTIVVKYTPSSTGLASGKLNLLTDSTTSPTESLTISGLGVVPPVVIPPLQQKFTLRQSGKAKRVPGHKFKVVMKAYFPIPSGMLGSELCTSRASLSAQLPGVSKAITTQSVLGWFGRNCAASFALRVPPKKVHKTVGFDYNFTGNVRVAPASQHFDIRIK